jgi:mRNA-degrading endonuclease RelE of RelBE toxin-antitoxin system
VIADAAVVQIGLLPIGIQIRIDQIVARVRNWPNVSGAKPLRGPLKGAYRIRTGGYRVLFSVDVAARRITLFRVADRRDVYE